MSLLQGIMKPAQADIMGNYQKGKKIAATDAIGQFLSEKFTGKLGAAAQLDPYQAMDIAKALNIPLDSKARIDNMMGITIAATQMIKAGQVQEAIQFLDEEANNIESLTGEPATNLRTAQMAIMNGDQETVSNFMAAGENFLALAQRGAADKPKFSAKTVMYKDGSMVQSDNQGNRVVTNPTGQIVEGEEAVNTIEAGRKSGIADSASAAGARARATGDEKIVTERSLNSVLAARKKGEAIAANEADMLNNYIDEGLNAVDALPNVQRGLELLKTVKTGGMTAKSKAVTDFFGTTSGDVAELNNILAEQVLAGLSAFTGAISEGEREFIAKMETNLSQGTAFNIRQLQKMEYFLNKKVKMAIEAAKVTGNELALNILNEGGKATGFGQRQPIQQQTEQPQPTQQTNTVNWSDL